MTIKKCDRCGALYEFVPGTKMNVKYQVREKVPEKLSNARVLDLCPACYESLTRWVNREE